MKPNAPGWALLAMDLFMMLVVCVILCGVFAFMIVAINWGLKRFNGR